jgi:serine/threonine-protein kinase HipA
VKSETREALGQQFRRAIFNIIGRNQDDHTKNIAFLMDRAGNWKLSPAYDMAYSYNPTGEWTNKHQMSLNGKRDNFTMEDLIEFGAKVDIKKMQATKIIKEIENVFSKWSEYAERADVFKEHTYSISNSLREISLF